MARITDLAKPNRISKKLHGRTPPEEEKLMKSTNRHAIRQAAAPLEDPGGSANTSPQEY